MNSWHISPAPNPQENNHMNSNVHWQEKNKILKKKQHPDTQFQIKFLKGPAPTEKHNWKKKKKKKKNVQKSTHHQTLLLW